MSATGFTGPIIVCRENPLVDLGTPVNVSANQNPDSGPSMFHMGSALLDPRVPYTYYAGDAQNPLGFTSAGVAITTAPVLGWNQFDAACAADIRRGFERTTTHVGPSGQWVGELDWVYFFHPCL